MNDFLLKINKEFDKEFEFLKLFDVIYDMKNQECQITFLYPADISEITMIQRKKLAEFVKKNININGKIVIKFKKSYLDKRLINSTVFEFLKLNFNSLSTYLIKENIEIITQDNTVKIIILLPDEMIKFFNTFEVSSKLINHLNQNFIASFDVEAKICDNLQIEREIVCNEVPVVQQKNRRYKFRLIKEVFGGEIFPKPEFIKDNSQVKLAVILAGKISKIIKKTYTRKKGKNAGQEGVYYNFVLNDGNAIECVYFCNKSNEKKFDVLEDGMNVACVGDLKLGLGDKLNYYIKKMSLVEIDEASKIEKIETPVAQKKGIVKPERFENPEQDSLFKQNVEYNDYVKNNNFVVYDLETTGIDSQIEKIVEIGAIKIENGDIIQKFSCFVNPQMPIPELATKVHHITDDMVKDAPIIEDVLLDFLDFCKDCVVMGYNNINFDNKFIKKECKNLDIDFDFEFNDVMNVAKSAKLGLRNYKLSTVAEYLNISLKDAHRAYNDAFATAKIFLKLNEI